MSRSVRAQDAPETRAASGVGFPPKPPRRMESGTESPFAKGDGPGAVGLLAQAAAEKPDDPAVQSAYAKALWLANDREQRYATAGEFAQAIKDAPVR